LSYGIEKRKGYEMSKRLLLGSLVTAASIALTLQTAQAGCAEDIKEIKEEKKNAVGMSSGASDAFNSMIARAEAALAAGKKKKCAKLVESARRKL